jgi:hypothetical protein
MTCVVQVAAQFLVSLSACSLSACYNAHVKPLLKPAFLCVSICTFVLVKQVKCTYLALNASDSRGVSVCICICICRLEMPLLLQLARAARGGVCLGTHFTTCVNGTKVLILTQKALLQEACV